MTSNAHRSLLAAMAVTATVVAVGCGNDSSADQTTTMPSSAQYATTNTSATSTTTTTATSRARTGDDGLTYAHARRAERSAKKRVNGVVIEIDRDNEDNGTISYDVDVLNRAGKRTQVSFDGRFRVQRKRTKSRPDHLTYQQAVRARKAALRRTSGVVVDIDGEDEGRVRFEVDVLTPKAGLKTIRLSSSYAVVPRGSTSDDDD